MKFYRVRYSTEGGNSGGFSWHTSRLDAVSAAKADYDSYPAEYNHVANFDDRIDVIDVTPTRAGILSALRVYATHPDNG